MKTAFARITGLTTVTVVVAAMIACSQPGDPVAVPDPNPTCHGKIASFAPLTGPSSAVGLSVHQGTLLAVDNFRATTPGCVIDLVVKDSPQVTPGKAADIAQELAQDSTIIGVVGPAYTADAVVANRILSDAGLTFIIPAALLPELSEKGTATFHRIVGNSTAQGPAISRYITNTVHARKVFIVDDETTLFTKDIVQGIRDNVPIVGTATFRPGATDFTAIVQQIIASNADAVFVGGFYTEVGLLARQLRQAGSNITFLTGSGALADEYVATAGAAAEGTIIVSSAVPPVEGEGKFSALYEEKFHSAPDYYVAEGFDAASILLAGIKAGASTRAEMEKFVDGYEGEGVTGAIKFGANGELDPYLVSIWVYKVQDGKIVADREMYASPPK